MFEHKQNLNFITPIKMWNPVKYLGKKFFPGSYTHYISITSIALSLKNNC